MKLHCQLSLEESDLGIPQKRRKKINDNIAHNLNLGSNQELTYFGCVMDTKKHMHIA